MKRIKSPLIGLQYGMYDLSSELLSSSFSFLLVRALINYTARLYVSARLTADTWQFSIFSIAFRFIIWWLIGSSSLPHSTHVNNLAIWRLARAQKFIIAANRISSRRKDGANCIITSKTQMQIVRQTRWLSISNEYNFSRKLPVRRIAHTYTYVAMSWFSRWNTMTNQTNSRVMFITFRIGDCYNLARRKDDRFILFDQWGN